MATRRLNNRYEILETLGRGGFGETFLACDHHLPSARQCVIKHLKPVIEASKTPQWLEDRFAREAAILEELGEAHEQIPNLYAYFNEGKDFYLVQEWIPGSTLQDLQEKRGNLSESEVLKILLEILPILEFIHHRRIIHRDIKPDNIILRQGDQCPVLIDFGIIKETIGTLVNPDGRSAYSVALGTPGYMASEQAAGRPVYSSDLYSLGLTAIFLLTGKSPQYLSSDPRSGELLWQKSAPPVSPEFASILNQSVRYHPRDRFASAKAMRQALQSLSGGSYPSTSKQQSAPRSTVPTQVVSPKGDTNYSEPEATTVYTTEYVEEETDGSPWVTWFMLPLIFLTVIVGGIMAGFWVANQRRTVPPEIDPQPTPTLPPIQQPTPEIFEPPIPTPTPTRTPVPTQTSTPEATPEPSPEETSPEPTPSPGSIPSPATQPTPNNAPSPKPKLSPTPSKTPTQKPSSRLKSTPSPNPTATPVPPKPTSPPITPTPAPVPIEPIQVIPPKEANPPGGATVTPPAPPASEKE